MAQGRQALRSGRWRLAFVSIIMAVLAIYAFPRETGLIMQVSGGLLSPPEVPQTAAEVSATAEGAALVAAAEAQVGRVRIYDPAYVSIAFPGGDVSPERGVCTDVLIRALRVAHGIDLQLVIHRDMQGDFAAYPDLWGLNAPDPNIDHRRVHNLRRLLERIGAAVPVGTTGAGFLPGDVVTQRLPGGQTHVVIVTHRLIADGTRPLVVHNIGAGTRVEDVLFAFEITGQYRLDPTVFQRLRKLAAQ